MNCKGTAVVAAAVALLAAFFVLVPPIPQDPAYHAFADVRNVFGIPNAWNVASNLPFLVVGAWGLVLVMRRGPPVCLPGLELACIVFFSGVFLTAFGSAYYHLAPSNETLAWDRLPMTIAFAGLFAIVLGEFVSPRVGRTVLVPLLLAGVLSVEYWAFTEARGVGDLRPYAVVQFLPLLLTPIILLLYRPAVGAAKYYWLMLVFYAASKLVEFLDVRIFAAGGFISGHALKHLLAAAATATLLFAFVRRRAKG